MIKTRSFQPTIVESASLEQLIKTIDDPDLLVRILLAYRTYRHLMDLTGTEINKDQSKEFASVEIPTEIAMYFLKAAVEATKRISELK